MAGAGSHIPAPPGILQELADLRREVDNLKLGQRVTPSLYLRDLLDCKRLAQSANGNQPTYDTASGLWLPT